MAEKNTDAYPEAFLRITEAQRIKVLYEDSDVVVIDKPPNLRSVPGHAEPPPPKEGCCNNNNNRKRKLPGGKDDVAEEPAEKRLTSQEAWAQSIRELSVASIETTRETFPNKGRTSQHEVDDKDLDIYLRRLGEEESRISSVPRKLAAFTRYILRSQKRIFGEYKAEENAQSVARELFQRIQQRQRILINAPAQTLDHESALGQLRLAGLAKSIGQPNDSSSPTLPQDMFPVHRLDCATSGVMVFARNSQTASFLSAAWRERRTTKIYHALVHCWDTKEKEGRIDVPLIPHPTERLKWVVARDDDDKKEAKPSSTLWKVLSSYPTPKGGGTQSTSDKGCILLELTPITGRTHQLRVHCAFQGSTIVGDTLYDNTTLNGETEAKAVAGDQRLCLHAQKLTFPHPTLGKDMTFSTEPDWELKIDNKWSS